MGTVSATHDEGVSATRNERGYPNNIRSMDNLEASLCYNPKWLPGADRVCVHISSSPISHRYYLVAAWLVVIIFAASGGASATLIATRGFG